MEDARMQKSMRQVVVGIMAGAVLVMMIGLGGLLGSLRSDGRVIEGDLPPQRLPAGTVYTRMVGAPWLETEGSAEMVCWHEVNDSQPEGTEKICSVVGTR
jgi:hypothetical protein